MMVKLTKTDAYSYLSAYLLRWGPIRDPKQLRDCIQCLPEELKRMRKYHGNEYTFEAMKALCHDFLPIANQDNPPLNEFETHVVRALGDAIYRYTWELSSNDLR